jgi:probable rRNA maturation factor
MPPRVTLHRPRPVPEARALPSPRAFERLLARSGVRGGEINLILTDADELRRLNRRFLGKDRETDVIAFDYLTEEADPTGARADRASSPGRDRLWGDVYVSRDAALAQARERGIPLREELARLFLHGCLHLLGHRDGTRAERARMEAAQEALLRELLSAGAGKRTTGRRLGAAADDRTGRSAGRGRRRR